jgi:hypothetical protein
MNHCNCESLESNNLFLLVAIHLPHEYKNTPWLHIQNYGHVKSQSTRWLPTLTNEHHMSVQLRQVLTLCVSSAQGMWATLHSRV